jgi:hypothetical protein
MRACRLVVRGAFLIFRVREESMVFRNPAIVPLCLLLILETFLGIGFGLSGSPALAAQESPPAGRRPRNWERRMGTT